MVWTEFGDASDGTMTQLPGLKENVSRAISPVYPFPLTPSTMT